AACSRIRNRLANRCPPSDSPGVELPNECDTGRHPVPNPRRAPMSLTSRRHDTAAVTMLKQRLQSLDEHCLNDLVGGLRAMGEGDLTVEVAAVTTPIEDARAGGEI